MLHIHSSNRLEALGEALAVLLESTPVDPFEADNIIVQSNGMARWLQLRLAEAHGVAANLRFPYPASFIWLLGRHLLPGLPEVSPFAKPVLTWRILDLLPRIVEQEGFAEIRHWLQSGGQRRSYELAWRLADLYDQYLVYRPDWIAAWEEGEESHWQAVLWRILADGQAHLHRAGFHKALLKALKKGKGPIEGLPSRLCVFGVSAMPPADIDILSALGKRIPVHLFLLNPCQEYWGDIVTERRAAKAPSAALFSVGNPLLASWGKQGRDFIDLLQEHGASGVEPFADPEDGSLLAQLQRDVLRLEDSTQLMPKPRLHETDDSLSVQVCHSPMREVQVLHDRLLDLFSRHSDLTPDQVVVMTPDIERYVPYIEAVFGSAGDEQRIPYLIADRGTRQSQRIIDVALRLLSLSRSRYGADEVLAPLEVAAVRRRFDIAEADLPLLRHWVAQVQIRWGIDEQHRAGLGLPAVAANSWRAGLQRLLLGVACGRQSGLIGDILPYDDLEGSEAQLLGRFISYCERLFSVYEQWQTQRDLSQWCDWLLALLDELLLVEDDEETQLQQLRETLQGMAQSAQQAGFEEMLDGDTLLRIVERNLEGEEPHGRFLAGSVTFCAMVPMRSVPFEVVCLLGLNDGEYPRHRQPMEFDLMANDFRPGDRSRRDDDRYLFLEALLSARRVLYLSHVGRSARDDSELPPSVLVAELLDYIDRAFVVDDGTVRHHLLTQHPLQAFSPRYFRHPNPEGLFSYAEDQASAAGRVGGIGRKRAALMVSALPEAEDEIQQISVSELLGFYHHPVRWFLRECLGIAPAMEQQALSDREDFRLEGLERYQVAEQLLLAQLGVDDMDAYQERLRAEDVLPHGLPGDWSLQQEQERVAPLVDGIVEHGLQTGMQHWDIDTSCSGLRVQGRLSGLKTLSGALLHYRIGKLDGRHQLRLWVQHVLLNAACGAMSSVCIHEKGEWSLGPIPEPQPLLDTLLQAYIEGQKTPMPLFPRSSAAYADKIRAGKGEEAAMKAAQGLWLGGDFAIGEAKDHWQTLAWREDSPLDDHFCRWAETLFLPMLEHAS